MAVTVTLMLTCVARVCTFVVGARSFLGRNVLRTGTERASTQKAQKKANGISFIRIIKSSNTTV